MPCLITAHTINKTKGEKNKQQNKQKNILYYKNSTSKLKSTEYQHQNTIRRNVNYTNLYFRY